MNDDVKLTPAQAAEFARAREQVARSGAPYSVDGRTWECTCQNVQLWPPMPGALR